MSLRIGNKCYDAEVITNKVLQLHILSVTIFLPVMKQSCEVNGPSKIRNHVFIHVISFAIQSRLEEKEIALSHMDACHTGIMPAVYYLTSC